MSVRYLLDTNTVSYVITGKPCPVRSRLNALAKTVVGLSAFTQAEMLYGLARKPQAAQLRTDVEKFLRDFQIFPWDSHVAAAYGDLRAAQERKGRRLSHEDLMIAARALALGLTLVTHDQVFAFVDGLKTEDWTVA
jgi:tRNA(fMet)-specific endonuclease VapC